MFISVNLFHERPVAPVEPVQDVMVENEPPIVERVEREIENSIATVIDEPLVGANQIKISFKNVRDVRVRQNGIESLIDENTFYGGISIKNAIAEKKIYGLSWGLNERTMILISKRDPDMNVLKVMRIFIALDHGRINAYYFFAEDGLVEYNINKEQSTTGLYNCELMIDPEEIFWIRVQWLNVRLVFKVMGTVVKLHDCESLSAA